MIDEFLMAHVASKSLNRRLNLKLKLLQFRKNIRKFGVRFGGFLEDIDAIEKAGANGEVIDDLDEGEKRSAYEKPCRATDRDCWSLKFKRD